MWNPETTFGNHFSLSTKRLQGTRSGRRAGSRCLYPRHHLASVVFSLRFSFVFFFFFFQNCLYGGQAGPKLSNPLLAVSPVLTSTLLTSQRKPEEVLYLIFTNYYLGVKREA